MFNSKIIFITLTVILTIGYLLSLATSVSAQDFFPIPGFNVPEGQGGGLVPCGNIKDSLGRVVNPCTSCDIFVLIQNILNFLWYPLSVSIAALMFAYGGFLMIVGATGEISLGGGQKSSYLRGKKVITNTIIGVAIVFFAWLTIDTIIKVVAGQTLAGGTPALIPKNIGLSPGNLGPWNKIECKAAPLSAAPAAAAEPAPSATPAPQTPDARSVACPACVKIDTRFMPVKYGACAFDTRGGRVLSSACEIDGAFYDRLVALNQKLPSGYWQITEAWPPTVTHQNPCHSNGTCIDANLRGDNAGKPQEIASFITRADQNGLKAVYEVISEERKQELIRAGVPSERIITPLGITGEHFSVYLK